MRELVLISFFIYSTCLLFGQQPIAEYSLDCDLSEENGFFDDITTPFFPSCQCGIEEESFVLSDQTDLSADTMISEIFADDFGISFYFKTNASSPVQELISVGDNCSSDSTFRVYYLEGSGEVIMEMSQSIQRTISLRATVDENKCWQHIIISRNINDFFIYINGELKAEVNSAFDIQIGNKFPINIGHGPCVSVISNEFLGQIDELKFFNQFIQQFRASELYIPNNEILSRDTTLFVGDEITINSVGNCNNTVFWSPALGINDVSSDTILLEGIETTDYVASFTDASGSQCISTDTIRIIVIDPNDLQCDDLILPNVFTPNGDGINETFHILNGFIVQELKTFEIFNRWGEVVFRTTNKSDEWDGNYKGQAVQSSMLLYKIVYICEGEELVKTGNISILR